jgi:predicted RNase H-like nuclease (RuvC/YqgF family)
MLFLFSDNDRLKLKIAEIEGNNKALRIENNKVKKDIEVLKDSISEISSVVDGIMKIEGLLIQNIRHKEKELNNLQKKYEKAISHTDNFNGDSIRVYFSNL